MAKGYNRENKLKLIIDIQSIYQQHKHEGITGMWIWKTYIYPTYKITYRTLSTYLATPATAELKKLQHARQNKNKVAAKQAPLGFADEDDY